MIQGRYSTHRSEFSSLGKNTYKDAPVCGIVEVDDLDDENVSTY